MECKLCGLNKELKDSHLTPKFIYKWLVKTSETGYLRTTENPNRKQQDGLKLKFLCAECEEKLSKLETFFSRKIFHEATKQNLGIYTVTEVDYRFVVSVLWRNSEYYISTGKGLENLTVEELSSIKRFNSICREYLNNERIDLDEYHIHVIPLTEEAEEYGVVPSNTFWNQRGTASNYQAFCKEQEGFDYLLMYLQIPLFFFVAEIIPNKEKIWNGTLMEMDKVLFDYNNIRYPEEIIEIMRSIYIRVTDATGKMSPKQKKYMEDLMKSTIDEDQGADISESIRTWKKSKFEGFHN